MWQRYLELMRRITEQESHLGVVHELVQELLVFQPGPSLVIIQLCGRIHTLHPTEVLTA